MKKIIFLTLAFAIFSSCGSRDKGELVGVKGKRWHPEKPYGMSLIPGGAFVMGKADDDVVDLQDAPTKTVTVRSFYMDETEITNSEYRQFVHWVRDSILREKLAEMADLEGKTSEDEGIGQFAYLDSGDEEELTPYQRYMLDTYGDEQRQINRDADLIFDTEDYPDELYAEVMDGMYNPKEKWVWYDNKRTMDVSKFKFDYVVLDLEGATKFPELDPKEFIDRPYEDLGGLEVYPDTTVWVRDFEYAYNMPMVKDYFSHEAFSNYPVVGITWDQANAFCQWRTMLKNSYQKSKGKQNINMFRLPSEAEWEYAARGGLDGAAFPWGGPYTKNDRGCFLANFKPLRGNYAADQALYTVEADAYEPNDYNLYNMAGNVSEWVNSSYDASSYEYSASFNPNVDDKENPRKVVRGGSWKDVSYFLQVSTRDYEHKDHARSYIGFRTVQDYLGTDATANAATN
ncbi:gliding motility lipoprotein GldK [Flavobacteriaceae bacterium]|nr:gliding motility lipoprotein GldK [Flavobacteriaceae bacterium]